MNRVFFAVLGAMALAAGVFGAGLHVAEAATPPGKITFLAATCPATSSMYQRVVAGQDPNSGENGNPADPADIAAYGCTPSSGLGFFLLANSTAQSLFLDPELTNAVTASSTQSGPAGATIIASGTTAYVPGGVAQTRRFSVSNYPTTITARAAMPFLDLQCLTDGYNDDNADGAGWDNQAVAAGAQTYCIAYVWDGVAEATATPTATTATATATPAASPTAASTKSTVTVNFAGLSSVHVYAHAADGVAGSAGGPQVASSTWKSDSTTLSVNKGTYDIRVVHGPTTVVIDNVDCSVDCTVNVPLANLSVNFPGLKSAHTYAHISDGQAGTFGAEDSSSTWKDDGTTLTLLRGTYDVRVVHGPTTVVMDNVDCRLATCAVNVPLATLTVNFPGLTSAHSYAHRSDGTPGTFGAEDTSSTWKDNSTSMVLLQAVYDVRVVHGPMQSVFDGVDCRAATCQVDVPLAKLTVNFPGLTSAHTYAHKSDGATGTYGSEDSSSTWKDNATNLTLLQGVYDVRVVHGAMQSVFDDVDCRSTTCQVDVPLAKLTVNFPGLTSAHTYAHKSDGLAGTYGSEDSSSTWKDNATNLTLLQGVYDVRVVHGPTTSVIDNVDCRQATCAVDVPLATLTITFAGHSNVHTYVRADDGATGSATGAEDSSSTWKTNGTSFTLLRSVYDVFMKEGSKSYIVDAVDCRTATCSATMPEQAATTTPAATVTPTATPSPSPAPATASATASATPAAPPAAGAASLKKTFLSADDTTVRWKLEPSAPADMAVWDAKAESCEAFGGASCGAITTAGPGMFSASASSQYLVVTQSYSKDGESCSVKNTAEWAADPAGTRTAVDASYLCSGAPTMGWPLFTLFATGAVCISWAARRKLRWPD